MRPFTVAFAREQLTPQQQDIVVDGHRFRADVERGTILDVTGAAIGDLPIAYVMGGKNVCYFLTPQDRGRLQVLPVAYDVRRKEWYDVAASGLRHFADVSERAVHWTDRELTFNTSCHGCHVSQLHTNYNPVTDAYQSTWTEPGINCETCHGPGEEHIRAAKAAGPGKSLADAKLIVAKRLAHQRKNELCASCHARLLAIRDGFLPGHRYFDSFDLVGIENRDFYPDGRDLGEAYTFTSWRQSPCARSDQLDCLHCHSSSGRFRWTERASANQACLPCHKGKVDDVLAHSHHPGGSATCLDCHMPKTEFARMGRSDHSMRPPAPAATIAFGSPNACNLCHRDKDASWSDRLVRTWHARDYQAPVLAKGALIAAARKGDWSKLPAMLAQLNAAEPDEVFRVALLRLLGACPSDDKGPTVLRALSDPSPWVRAAAAETVGQHLTPEAVGPLLNLTRDPVRLPRVRAANALASLPRGEVPRELRGVFDSAMRELEASLSSRPDDPAMQYDLGRLYASRSDTARAITAYETAIRLRPDMVAALVNVSLLYNSAGRNSEAEAALRRALGIEPGNSAAHLNLGMLLGELGRFAEAEAALRAALREDPNSAAAAYNLAVVVSRDRPDEAVTWSRRAAEINPASPKYAYTFAFYLAARRDKRAAIAVLRRALAKQAVSGESYALLAKLLGETGKTAEAKAVFGRAATDARISAADRARFGAGGGRAP